DACTPHRHARGTRAEVARRIRPDYEREIEASHRARLQAERSGAGAERPRCPEDNREAATGSVALAIGALSRFAKNRRSRRKRKGPEGIASGPSVFCAKTSWKLEDQLQAQLERSRSALSKRRVGAGDVRCLWAEAKRCSRARSRISVGVVAAGSAEDVGEVDAVQDIEAFGAELRGQAFSNLELFGNREIPFIEGEPAEVVAPGGSERAVCRWNQERVAVRIATQISKGCHSQRAVGRGLL